MPLSSFTRSPFPGDSDNKDEPKKPSLMQRLATSSASAAFPPKPKPFHMSEPYQQPGGLWAFWLTADDRVLKYVGSLSCILSSSNQSNSPFARPARGRMMFNINPRYEHEEVWLWIHRLLEGESEEIELSNTWENVLVDEDESDENEGESQDFDFN
jgi:hypothetical protein